MKTSILVLLLASSLCSGINCSNSAGFTCPDFADKTVTQCSNYTGANIYYTDIKGIWIVREVTYTPPEKCDYAEFRPAIGDSCMSKLFGYSWYTSVDKATNVSTTQNLNWITTGLGQVYSIVEGSSSTSVSVVIAYVTDGFVLIRCPLSGGTNIPPYGLILTRKDKASKQIIYELKEKAKQAGYTTKFQLIDQKHCPPTISHVGPIVTIT